MEFLYNDWNGERLVSKVVSQALVDGAIPVPEGRSAALILSAGGEVIVSSAETVEGRVILDGRVKLDIFCADAQGKPFAFVSTAPFKHTIPCEGALPGMTAKVQACLQTLQVEAGGGMPELNAVVDLTCSLFDASPLRVLAGIRGVNDMEFKNLPLNIKKRESLGRCTSRMREEVVASGVSAVLSGSGCAVIRDIQAEGNRAVVEGTLTIMAVCEGSDGRLTQLVQHIPFAESVELDGDPGQITGSVQAENLVIRPLGEEFSLLSVEADLKIDLFGVRRVNLDLPVDAYSPSVALACKQASVTLPVHLMDIQKRVSLSENVSVPEGMPNIYRIVASTARPVITCQSCEQGRLCVDGILFTYVIYQCEEGRLHAFTEDIPFTHQFDADCSLGSQADVEARCVCVTAAGGGRSAEVSFTLFFNVELYDLIQSQAAVGAEECEAGCIRHGLVIYFAGAGETLFDVAKRFSTTRTALLNRDPSLKEELNEGDKLVLMV